MASKTRYCSLLFIIAVLLMVAFEEASAWNNNVEECLYEAKEASTTTKLTRSRKVLAMLKCNSGVHSATRVGNGEKVVGRELRTAPSGPDPLHHHGNSPKKPRSDP